eukprot:gene5172-925_t
MEPSPATLEATLGMEEDCDAVLEAPFACGLASSCIPMVRQDATFRLVPSSGAAPAIELHRGGVVVGRAKDLPEVIQPRNQPNFAMAYVTLTQHARTPFVSSGNRSPARRLGTRHCRVELSAVGDVIIHDTSTNGTFVNRRKIGKGGQLVEALANITLPSSGHVVAALCVGDQIHLFNPAAPGKEIPPYVLTVSGGGTGLSPLAPTETLASVPSTRAATPTPMTPRSSSPGQASLPYVALAPDLGALKAHPLSPPSLPAGISSGPAASCSSTASPCAAPASSASPSSGPASSVHPGAATGDGDDAEDETEKLLTCGDLPRPEALL